MTVQDILQRIGLGFGLGLLLGACAMTEVPEVREVPADLQSLQDISGDYLTSCTPLSLPGHWQKVKTTLGEMAGCHQVEHYVNLETAQALVSCIKLQLPQGWHLSKVRDSNEPGCVQEWDYRKGT